MKKSLLIFTAFIAIRVAYIFLSGFSSCDLCQDCNWINELSERVLVGNFNFDVGRFIASPFYNVFIAVHKIIFGQYWATALVTSQLVLSGLSGVYFYKLGLLLFEKRAAIISTAIFSVFPLTLYWVHTFCTESIFQSLLIISIFFLVNAVKTKSYRDVIISSSILSIVFLTKSHILLFTPFIALYLFINNEGTKKFTLPILYGAICFLFTLPFGIYNLKVNHQYVLSSNGNDFHFYTGNSPYGYKVVVDVPPKGTEEFKKLGAMDMAYFNGSVHDSIMKLPQNVKQKLYLNYAINWIKNNPKKFLETKLNDFILFIIPGTNFKYYSFLAWLFTFLISLPIYLLGYFGIVFYLKKDFRLHFYALGLFLSMLIFSVVWYVQNRFRTITIEPIYILYSGAVIHLILKKYLGKKRPKVEQTK